MGGLFSSALQIVGTYLCFQCLTDWQILPKTPKYYFGVRFYDFDCMFLGLVRKRPKMFVAPQATTEKLILQKTRKKHAKTGKKPQDPEIPEISLL